MQAEINIRRLSRLAEILDVADAQHRKAKEPGYEQSMPLHSCGTPACALGHWAVNNRRRFKIDKKYGFVTLKAAPNILCCGEIAQIEFGMTRAEGEELFEVYGCDNAQTAKQAARYIRKFIARKQKVTA